MLEVKINMEIKILMKLSGKNKIDGKKNKPDLWRKSIKMKNKKKLFEGDSRWKVERKISIQCKVFWTQTARSAAVNFFIIYFFL